MSARLTDLLEIARVFLKIGAMSYGGPAIMGIMQTEIQEKRNWISKEQFVEGLALVNTLPGPLAAQLAIFIGYAKGRMAGGVLAGICFVLPAFFIMLALASAYTAYGAFPAIRNALYGVGPVVIGIFAAAVYRLGKGSIKQSSQVIIAAVTALVILLGAIGLVLTLLISGCVGIALFHSRQKGMIALAAVLGLFAVIQGSDLLIFLPGTPVARDVIAGIGAAPSLWNLGIFFFKVGAFTFGGGLSMFAFIQEQVVIQFAWLTPQEFVDGLALGQLTPGPVLMLAAYVGFKLLGIKGATVAAAAIFLPSFLMMLSILPVLNKMKDLQWLKAFMRGVSSAVIGTLAAALAQMTPHAAPDAFTVLLLIATIAIILLRNVGPLPLVFSGALIGALSRSSLLERLGKLVG